jgi:DNA-binding transcriptional LysR family regulator
VNPDKNQLRDELRFMHRIDWNLFRQFYEIVQAGSLSAAARRLNLHQPSLSAALKRLEDHLQLSLARRTSQGIDLTPAGKALFQLASEMVETVRLVPHLTSQAANRIEGTITIWMISNIVASELDESLQSFHRRYPEVEIRIEIFPWRDVLSGVVAMECDVGITHDAKTQPDLQYYPLLLERQQLYCGRTHPLYGQHIREPADLARERMILTHGDEPEDLAAFRNRFGLGEQVAGHAEDLHEAMRLIELGIGVGFLPTIVADLADTGRLWPILPVQFLPSYFIYVITPSATRLSTPAQLFLQEVRRRLAAKRDFD